MQYFIGRVETDAIPLPPWQFQPASNNMKQQQKVTQIDALLWLCSELYRFSLEDRKVVSPACCLGSFGVVLICESLHPDFSARVSCSFFNCHVYTEL